ncbi:RNA polymerase sigma factor [Kitasatospora sp. NPDC004615]|uniref:RNA polymerase sigma factor n=1 Tax=unclassified Kitasatospora TaxID=2633591 RepID=UPI0036CAF0B3
MPGQEDPRERHRWLEALYGAHADRVMGYLVHRTDRDTAQEIVSETFLLAWRKQKSVPDDALPWLLAAARRLLANRVRSDLRRQALAERMQAVLNDAPSTAFEDRVADREHVFRVLMLLTETDREVLLLAGWYDLTAQQAATALGCSRAAYTLRLHRARKRFRTALEQQASLTTINSEVPA